MTSHRRLLPISLSVEGLSHNIFVIEVSNIKETELEK